MVKILEISTGYLTTNKRHQLLCGCITTSVNSPEGCAEVCGYNILLDDPVAASGCCSGMYVTAEAFDN